MLRKLNETGDTIIEVMVVLAVLGLAIGVSYATANRSLLASRGAQESSEATQLVQSQVEYLRAYARADASDSAHYIFTPNRIFCFDTAGSIVANFTGTDTNNLNNYPVNPGPPVTYPCLQGSRYYLSIKYIGADPTTPDNTDTFTVQAIWDDVQGLGNDRVTLVYRIHPQP